jgi:mono/diheme cytochrome c family protein
MKNQMIWGLVLTLAMIIFVGIYWAREPGRQAQAQVTVDNHELLVGAKLFASNCAECHGEDGQGFEGPELNGTDLPKDLFTEIVRNGYPHTIMPAWSAEFGGPFDQSDIDHVVNFIYNWNEDILTQARAELGPETGMDMGGPYTMPGEELFHTKGCAECHGDDGMGRVFTWSEQTCGRCHPDETNLLQYTPMVVGHEDQEVVGQVRNGGDFMQPFSTETISDAELQQIIDWIHTLTPPVIEGELKADLDAASAALQNGDDETANTDLQNAFDIAPHDIWKARIQTIIDQVNDEGEAIAIAMIAKMEENPQD